MTPGQIKALIATLLLAGAIAAAYFTVDAYNTAIEENTALSARVAQLNQNAIDQEKAIKELRKAAAEEPIAAETKNAERQKAADTFTKDTKEYHHEIEKSPQPDIDCARRTVPSAVDELLAH